MMTVSVPLPWELKASMVCGLKVAPSLLPARGRVVMILPSTALRMTQVACRRSRPGTSRKECGF